MLLQSVLSRISQGEGERIIQTMCRYEIDTEHAMLRHRQ